MDEKPAKVHHKSKHRRGASSRRDLAEPTTSPSKTATTIATVAATTPPPPTVPTTTTTSIVIVQSQSNDDERPESPASSINVNSKNVQSGVADTGTSQIHYFLACFFFIFSSIADGIRCTKSIYYFFL